MTYNRAFGGVSKRKSDQKLRLDPCHLPQSLLYQSPKSGKIFAAFLTERGISIQEQPNLHAENSRSAAQARLLSPMPRFSYMPHLHYASATRQSSSRLPHRISLACGAHNPHSPHKLSERILAHSQNSAGSKIADTVLKVFSPRRFRGIAARKLLLNSSNTAENPRQALCLTLLHDNADYSVPLLISEHKDDVVLDWRLWADIYNLPMLISEREGDFRPLGGGGKLKLFLNGKNSHRPISVKHNFSLRCRGISLNMRLILANQVMIG